MSFHQNYKSNGPDDIVNWYLIIYKRSCQTWWPLILRALIWSYTRVFSLLLRSPKSLTKRKRWSSLDLSMKIILNNFGSSMVAMPIVWNLSMVLVIIVWRKTEKSWSWKKEQVVSIKHGLSSLQDKVKMFR